MSQSSSHGYSNHTSSAHPRSPLSKLKHQLPIHDDHVVPERDDLDNITDAPIAGAIPELSEGLEALAAIELGLQGEDDGGHEEEDQGEDEEN